MRPVTLQRASHTEALGARGLLPLLRRKYPATRGGEEGEEGDFDEAGAGSDQTGGQWGSFP